MDQTPYFPITPPPAAHRQYAPPPPYPVAAYQVAQNPLTYQQLYQYHDALTQLAGYCVSQVHQGVSDALRCIQMQKQAPPPTNYRCRILQEGSELVLMDEKKPMPSPAHWCCGASCRTQF